MADPLSLIPEGKQYNELRWTLSILKQDFPQDYAGLANQESRIQSWVDDITAGRITADDKRDDIVKYIMDRETTKGVYGISDEEFDRLMLGANEGGIDFKDLTKRGGTIGSVKTGTKTSKGTATGVLAGGQTIRVGSNYYQVYEFPKGSKQYVSYQYNNLDMAKAALGENFPHTTWTASNFNTRVIAQSDAEEVVGEKGNWDTLTQDMMRDAAAAAGITDPGLAGRIASNPEMQQIMAMAVAGEWTPEQIRGEQRKTDFWKNELYPGIEQFYDMTDQPERAYKEYLNNASPYLNQLGYTKDADGSYKSTVKRMLDNEIDLNTFISQVPVYERAVQNAEFATTLNAWAEAELGRSIDFNDWFDLQAGESQPELEAVAEKATLQWVSDNQAAELSQAQIQDLAARTQMSAAEAAATFSEFNQGVLALGEQGLSKYGLSRDAVLAAAAGVTDASGRSPDEIKLLVAKTAREQALFDDEKINFYVGFNPATGTPERPGLRSLRPEGA